jgi:hypothetical protein
VWELFAISPILTKRFIPIFGCNCPSFSLILLIDSRKIKNKNYIWIKSHTMGFQKSS